MKKNNHNQTIQQAIKNKNLTPFNPPFWLSNPHIQTIVPKFIAPSIPLYRRELVKDALNESDVAYDFYDVADEPKPKKPLVVLFHGMEGSSESHYARTLAYQTHQEGWHFVVVHFRSCGGVPIQGRVFYNAGDTTEIHHAFKVLSKRYDHIFAVGVSLGGNALAKYLGEYGSQAICQGAVVASAPVDLASASMTMERFLGRKIYTPYLLNPIIKKALANQLSTEEMAAIKNCQRMSEFDDIFTAPRHGFRSKNDYYRQASALPVLLGIKRSTLLISAKDDPFLGAFATVNDVSDDVILMYPNHGGHIGFLRYRRGKLDINWLPETALSFFHSLSLSSSEYST